MKIIKYLIAAVLVISLSKKIHVQQDSNIRFTANISPDDQAKIKGSYDANNKTATIKFDNVVEYNRAVTPPNVANPDLILFGQFPTPGASSEKPLYGGLLQTTSLWGIAQTPESKIQISLPTKDTSTPARLRLKEPFNAQGRIAYIIDEHDKIIATYVGVIESSEQLPDNSIPALHFITKTKDSTTLYGIAVNGEPLTVKSKNKTIGLYWPDNKIVQITQGVNAGKTYVGIIEQVQGNYKKHNDFAIGPVTSWFDTDTIKNELLQTYGIPSAPYTNFDNLITQTAIGTARLTPTIGKSQTIKLYGVLLDTSKALKSPQVFSKYFIQSQAPKHILREVSDPRIDKFRHDMQAQTAQHALGIYQAVQPTPEVIEG